MRTVTIDSSGGGKPGTTWFPLVFNDVADPGAGGDGDMVRVKMIAGALNHRDVFQRQNAYPSLSVSSPVGADGVGVLGGGERVLLTPGRGWESDRWGPEGKYGILGGQVGMPGTFADYQLIHKHELVPCPTHLSDVEAAALPLAGLTAFRALFTKGRAEKGHRVLITGIGGGVALFALQFAVAAGCEVWVTSGSEEKISRAVELGAKGGVSYKTAKWGKVLAGKLGKDRFDLVIDSAGGNIVADVLPCIKQGRPIVAYGMTVAPKIAFSMAAVLANVEYRGSTMGSRREFFDMVAFVERHRIKPVVHKVYRGLEAAEEAFVEMRDGKQFGKIVVLIDPSSSAPAKL
ncbi:hypothetical protein PYCC9005_004784 [Savitreella phatthalungensis]